MNPVVEKRSINFFVFRCFTVTCDQLLLIHESFDFTVVWFADFELFASTVGQDRGAGVAFDVFPVTSETSEQTRKREFALWLKSSLASGEIVNPFRVVTA